MRHTNDDHSSAGNEQVKHFGADSKSANVLLVIVCIILAVVLASSGPDATAQTTPVALYAALSANPVLQGTSPAALAVIGCMSACGTVTYSMDGTVFQQLPVNSDGTIASPPISATLPLGPHTMQVSYGGSAQYTAATTSVTFTVVSSAPTALTLSLDVSPVPANETPHMIDQVGCNSCGVLYYYVDGTLFQNSTIYSNGSAGNLLEANIALGWHVLTARYGGSGSNTAASTSIAFHVITDTLPVPRLAAALSSSPVVAGTSPTVITVVSCTLNCGYFNWYVDGQLFQVWQISANGGPASPPISSSLAVGQHTLMVTYSGDAQYAPATTSFNFNVVSATPTSLSLGLNVSPVPVDETPQMTSQVGCNTACGLVYFYLDGALFQQGNITSNGSTGNVLNSQLPLGWHVLTVNYPGNSTYSLSNTSIPIQIIPDTLPVPTLTASLPSNPVIVGTSPNVTTTVGCGSSCSGYLTWYMDGTLFQNWGVASNGIDSPSIANSISAGPHTITVNYGGNAQYAPNTASLSFVVTQSTHGTVPVVTWPKPAPVSYGTTLTNAQLNASASVSGTTVPGTFTYSPAAGTTPTTGNDVLTVTFTPNDTSTYVTTAQSVVLTVNKAIPTMSWAAPAPITFGNQLTATQLNATTTIPGTMTYSPTIGSLLPTGTSQIIATFAPNDYKNYAVTTASVNATVAKASPSITWLTPNPITYGTALTTTQLSATASVPGTFSYTPAANTVLTAGTNSLSVVFTPTDTTDYSSVTGTTSIAVAQATPAISWSTPSAITYGTALSGTQLNPIASVPGSFSYSPPTGAMLAVGNQTLSATFTPTSANYAASTATVNLIVSAGSPSTSGVITTIAGDGQAGYTGDGGKALSASLGAPIGAVVDTQGNIYFIDTTGGVVRMVSAATGNISTVVGNGTATYNGEGISAISAGVAPAGLALDSAGNLYIADGNCLIRRVTFTAPGSGTGYIQTVAGTVPTTPGNSNCGDLSGSNSAQIYYPQGIAVDQSGDVYYTAAYRVWKLAPNGTVSLVAGNGQLGNTLPFGDGGEASNAELWLPTSVAIDKTSGNIYIGDIGSRRIRVVKPNGFIYTFAGGGTAGSFCAQATDNFGDGCPATDAVLGNPSGQLGGPSGVTVDAYGDVYFADVLTNVFAAGADLIRVVTSSSGMISVAAGGGSGCSQQTDSVGDGCPATLASLKSPGGVSTDTGGNLFVADSGNNRIRRIGSPANLTINLVSSSTLSSYGSAVTFIATISNGGPTGTITFYDGNTAIGTAPLSGTTATYTTTALTAGSHNITASWPGSSGFPAATSYEVAQFVNPATPVINWPALASIPYGIPLNPTQLDASANTNGSFSYSPAAGTILNIGSYTLSTTFSPTDSKDYTSAASSVGLTVIQATPAINWAPPSDITSGAALSTTQLNASSPVAGKLVYSPPLGTILAVGPHTLTVTLTPNDLTDYTTATATAYLTVTQGTSTWDSGTVTLEVNNSVVATTNYGQGSTASTIAAGLANGVTGQSPVNVASVDDALYIIAKTPGTGSDYTYSLQATAYSSASFSQPSFAYPVVSGVLDGGTNQGTNSGTTIYSYTVPSGGYDGVGNVKKYTDSVMGTWGFSYDTLNRLTGATDNQSGNTSTNYCWNYDPFGNRTIQAGSSAQFQAGSTPCTPASSASFTSAWANFNTSNQVTSTTQAPGGVSYDDAGEIVNDGVVQYLYDAEGRICAVATSPISGGVVLTGYVYDASGVRVAKGNLTAWSCDPAINGFQTVNDYVLGLSGEQVTEMGMNASNTMVWQHTNVYGAGRLLATYDDNGLHFYLDDPLGTRRAQTDYAGVLEQTCSSLPFGDGLACANSTQYPTEHHFTGKERDTESGLDYFGARYYSSSMGRWSSPDWSKSPSGVPYADLSNPQSLNLYSYVHNNPLSNIDDDGHATIEIRYTSIGPGYTHSYLVITDTNGARTYFRAGPSAGGPSSGSSGALSSASGGSSGQSSNSNSNSSNGSSPGSGPGGGDANTGPFGALHADSGAYVPGTIDYETNPAASTTLLSNDQPASGYIDQLSSYSNNINGANIPYNPLSTNSNAYAAGAANFLGLTVPKPPVNAPGSGTQLPVPPPAPPPPPPTPPCSVAGACPK